MRWLDCARVGLRMPGIAGSPQRSEFARHHRVYSELIRRVTTRPDPARATFPSLIPGRAVWAHENFDVRVSFSQARRSTL